MTLPTRVKLSKGQRAVLDLLRERPMTTADFLRSGVGSRFGARIGELRDRGFGIDTLPLKHGAKYTLEVDVERAARSNGHARDHHGAGLGSAPAQSGDAAGCSLDAQSLPQASTQSLFDDTAARRRLPFMDIDEEEAA